VRTPSVSLRLLLMIVLALAFALVTMPLFKAALETALPGPVWLQHLLHYQPGQGGAPATYDLGRISRRYLLLVALAVFIGLRRWVPWGALLRRGFPPRLNRSRHLWFGIAAGVVLATIYGALLVATGNLGWARPGALALAGRSMEFALGAAFIGLLEESMFRGVYFRAMVRDWGVTWAVVGSGSVFAVLHCISGGLRVPIGWSPAIGLTLFKTYFTVLGSPLPDLRLMVGLFLLATLLALLYLRTGALWTPIGLHGGLVFGTKLLKKMFDRTADFPTWLLGDRTFIVSGIAVWGLMLIAILVVPRLAPRGPAARRRQRRCGVTQRADSTPATG